MPSFVPLKGVKNEGIFYCFYCSLNQAVVPGTSVIHTIASRKFSKDIVFMGS
jgi:hypothetical protein